MQARSTGGSLRKVNIHGFIMEHIYGQHDSQQDKRMDAIIEKNSQLMGVDRKSMRFKGVSYVAQGYRAVAFPPRLHALLEPTMLEWLKDGAEVTNYEHPFVSSYVVRVLNLTTDPDYLRQLLPTGVHSAFSHLSTPVELRSVPALVIRAVLEENSDAIDLISRRLVINLIT